MINDKVLNLSKVSAVSGVEYQALQKFFRPVKLQGRKMKQVPLSERQAKKLVKTLHELGKQFINSEIDHFTK